MGEFVSLADLLRPPVPSAGTDDAERITGEPDAALDAESDARETETPAGSPSSSGELLAVLREARLFRARLADAFDEARGRLLRELATGVLARELQLAPCDVDALARSVCAEMPVVRVRVAPSEIAAVRGIPVVADAALASGDAVVELVDGAVDARLGVRLAIVLEAFA